MLPCVCAFSVHVTDFSGKSPTLSKHTPQLYTEESKVVERVNNGEAWIAVKLVVIIKGLMGRTLENLELKYIWR